MDQGHRPCGWQSSHPSHQQFQTYESSAVKPALFFQVVWGKAMNLQSWFSGWRLPMVTTPELVDLTLPSAAIPNKKMGLKYGAWKILCLQYSYLAYRKIWQSTWQYCKLRIWIQFFLGFFTWTQCAGLGDSTAKYLSRAGLWQQGVPKIWEGDAGAKSILIGFDRGLYRIHSLFPSIG